MTREELRHAMLITGELEQFTKSDNWQKAFELYKKETKDYEVSFGCASCYRKIKAWLNK